MREITTQQITEVVAKLSIEAACDLPSPVEDALTNTLTHEESPYGRYSLEKIAENIRIAREEMAPLCQDTGLATMFIELGQDVHITGGSLEDAINAGVAQGYEQGYLRKSMVADPLFDRKNTQDNTPAVIHIDVVPGDKLKITLLPKGGGSENMSALKMLKPAQGQQGVVDFVVDTVVSAGGSPCPPTIVGVGIGGNAEHALKLSKVALHRPLGEAHPDARYAALEREILEKINASGVGPQGLGGLCTALAVHIEHFPTHIAMLPVGVTLNCHVARCKEVTL